MVQASKLALCRNEPRAVQASAGRAWLGVAIASLVACNEPNPDFNADAGVMGRDDVPSARAADDPRSSSSDARSTERLMADAGDDATASPDGGLGCATLTVYADLDGDGYGDDSTATSVCTTPDEHVLAPGDCDDEDGDVSPAQADYFDRPASAAVGFDYDCDGTWQQRWPSLVSCRRRDGDCLGAGWVDAVPPCGVEAWFAECGREHGDCVLNLSRRTQRCR